MTGRGNFNCRLIATLSVSTEVASTFLLYSARTYTLRRLWSITDRIVSSRFSFAVESREREVPSAEAGPREGKGRGVPTGKSRRIVEGLFPNEICVFVADDGTGARIGTHTSETGKGASGSVSSHDQNKVRKRKLRKRGEEWPPREQLNNFC
jgi:hypothetical protein